MTSEALLEVRVVSKRLGNKSVLKNVSFSIARGELVGFIGPNGAGKTTTMKIICGLLTPDAGDVLLDGIDLRRHPIRVLSQVGALIESPGFYPSLNAFQHLSFLARLRGCHEDSLICQTLETVGLSPQSRKTVRDFSTGMKQRLGIAMAILHSPRLLILDEPMNGLDPAGIVTVRQLLKSLSQDHAVSVFVSSHLLHEVEQVCDRALFLKGGQIVGERQTGQAVEAELQRVWLRTSDNEMAKGLLSELEYVREVTAMTGGLQLQVAACHVPALVTLLVEEFIEIHELTPRPQTLEDVYLSEYGNTSEKGIE